MKLRTMKGVSSLLKFPALERLYLKHVSKLSDGNTKLLWQTRCTAGVTHPRHRFHLIRAIHIHLTAQQVNLHSAAIL
jgi:hypothetical protein